MIGTGTIANVAAIVLGGAIGLGVRGGLKAHYQEGLMKAMGLGTLFIGAAGALAGALTVQDGKVASLGTAATLSMILALALGTLVGEFFDFDGKMEHLGIWLKAKADKRGTASLSKALSPPPWWCAWGPWPLWGPSRTALPAMPPPYTPRRSSTGLW